MTEQPSISREIADYLKSQTPVKDNAYLQLFEISEPVDGNRTLTVQFHLVDKTLKDTPKTLILPPYSTRLLVQELPTETYPLGFIVAEDDSAGHFTQFQILVGKQRYKLERSPDADESYHRLMSYAHGILFANRGRQRPSGI